MMGVMGVNFQRLQASSPLLQQICKDYGESLAMLNLLETADWPGCVHSYPDYAASDQEFSEDMLYLPFQAPCIGLAANQNFVYLPC